MEMCEKRRVGRPIDPGCKRQKMMSIEADINKLEEKIRLILLMCTDEWDRDKKIEEKKEYFHSEIERIFESKKIEYGIIQKEKYLTSEFKNIYNYEKRAKLYIGLKLRHGYVEKKLRSEFKRRYEKQFTHSDLAGNWIRFYRDDKEDIFLSFLFKREEKNGKPLYVGEINENQIYEFLKKYYNRPVFEKFVEEVVPQEYMPDKLWDRIPIYTKMLLNYFRFHRIQWRNKIDYKNKDQIEFLICEEWCCAEILIAEMWKSCHMRKHVQEGSRVFCSIMKHAHFPIIFQKYKV